MKNTVLFIFTIFLSNGIIYAQCIPTNLIADPSFEIDAMALNMSGDCESTSAYTCVWNRNDGGIITNTSAYDGDYSWETNGGSAYQNNIDLSPNTDYILSCWIKTTNTSEYGVTMSNTSNVFAKGTWIGPTNGWEMISLPFTTTTGNLSSVMLELACHTGVAYFDLVELCEASTLSLDEEALRSNISVWPNPNKGIVNINLCKLEHGKRVDIKVFNTVGQLVFQDRDIKQDHYQFYFNDAPGLYFMEINANNKKQYFKLIKE